VQNILLIEFLCFCCLACSGFAIDIALFGKRLVLTAGIDGVVKKFREGPVALGAGRGLPGRFGGQVFAIVDAGEGVDGRRFVRNRLLQDAGFDDAAMTGGVEAGELGSRQLQAVEGAAGDLVIHGSGERGADDAGDDVEYGVAVLKGGDHNGGRRAGCGMSVAPVAAVAVAEDLAHGGGVRAADSVGAQVAAALLFGRLNGVGSFRHGWGPLEQLGSAKFS
jgi:hypothetical protein